MRAWRRDEGSTLILAIFYGCLAIVLVLVVTAATSLYLERKRLFTLADGAALVGAEAFDLDEVTVTDDGPRIILSNERVAREVADYISSAPDAAEFESLAIDRAITVDGRSATVALSAHWRPPLVTLVIPEGLRIDVEATARSTFGG